MRSWSEGDEPLARLPRIEDLPLADQGYDRAAVEAAFESFYRHAAQLDATLRVVEAVELFHRQAGDLRADIRALRAAAWGPVPDRSIWSGPYGTASYSAESARGRVPEAVPRLAIEAAFIILVAVGAALAGLDTALVVLLVLASWLVVGLGELLVAAARPSFRRPPSAEPVVAPAASFEEPPPRPVEPLPEPVGEVTMLELPLAEPVEEEVAGDAEPAVLAAVVPQEQDGSVPPPASRLRFWRRAQPTVVQAEDGAAPRHVRVLAADEAALAGADPWEDGPELPDAAAAPLAVEPHDALDDTEEPDEPSELEAEAAAFAESTPPPPGDEEPEAPHVEPPPSVVRPAPAATRSLVRPRTRFRRGRR